MLPSLPQLLTPARAAAYEAQAAAEAAQQQAGRRSLFVALVAATAFLLFAAGALAERYHLLPAPQPGLTAAQPTTTRTHD